MNRFLHGFLRRTIRKGSLEIVDSTGNGPQIRRRQRRPRPRSGSRPASAERGVILNPELKLGEEFMDGDFVVEAGSIYDLMERDLQQSGGTAEPDLPG